MYPEYELGPNGISSGHVHSLLSEVNGQFNVDAEKVAHLLEQFQKSEFTTLLLSSEHFFYHADALAKVIAKVRFIAYVRCPVETYESVYNQSVKRHGNTKPLSFGNNVHTTTLDRLSSLADNLTSGKIQFRAFAQSDENFNLVEDFLSLLKISRVIDNEKTNPSYTFEALETKRWLNRFELGYLDHKIDTLLQSTSAGTERYSLMPEELKARHYKQCINYLRLFHTKYHVKNIRILYDGIARRMEVQSLKQGDLEKPLVLFGGIFRSVDENLYSELLAALKKSKLANGEKKHIAYFSTQQQGINTLLNRMNFIKRSFKLWSK